METRTFAELWHAFKAGNAHARNRILTDFMPRIMGLLHKSLRRSSETEDVAQSVFVSFIANHAMDIAGIAKRDELWELFAAITLRHCSKHNKRRYRETRRGPALPLGANPAESAADYDPPDGGPPPDVEAALHDLFAQCNQELTDRQQEVLARHLAGMDRKEIARALDIAVPTVDRELKKIKAVLAQLAGDDAD